MKTNHYNVGRDSFPTNAWKQVAAIALALFCVFGVGVSRLDAGCIALDDVPLDVQQQQAPGIVMFCIDDSGSMDWETICPESSDGVFEGYEYIFADPGNDNTYPVGDGNGDIIEGSAKTNKWKSQWSGYNRLYYDPTATYTPWPTKDNANLNTPLCDPMIAGNTLNLSGVWFDFGEPLMSTDALVNAGAVFVDNKDTTAGQGLASEIIMDNVAANNDVLWDGADYGSFTSDSGGGPAWISATSSTTGNLDFETNYLYSSTSTSGTPNAKSKTYTATWQFLNLVSGKYDVYAWWVQNSSNATAAQYKINGVNVSGTQNQAASGSGGKWNLIASDQNLSSNPAISVSQTNGTTSLKRLCADAIKLVPKFPAVPPVLFQKTGPVTGLADQGWQLNTTPAAYMRPQDTSHTYYYTNAVGAFTATWTANNLNPTQLYDVYAVWAEGGTNRSNSVPYTTYHSTGTTVTNVNQQLSLGDWTKIAGGDDGITFTSGIGKVVLNRTTTSSTSGRACADAIAFVPHGDLNIKINRAHYYRQTTSGTYLVNIDGGTIKYYKYTDANSDNIVNGNELKLLTATEAATAGIVIAGRTYTQERQNFANWYSFYRRRELTAKNAISKVINDMQGVYIGLLSIHKDDSYGGIYQYALPVRVTLDNVTQDQSSSLFTTLYGMDSDGGTPLRVGLKNVGEYFKGTYRKPSPLPSTNFASNTYPFFAADKGGTCQQAFTIVMTDGYWNESYSGVGNADKNDDAGQIDGFDGPPFADEASDTLADVAMYYYERDLNTTLNNDVPVNAKDMADHQHLVTYTLSFGVTGTLNRDDYPDCPLGTCPSPWPDPFSSTDGNKKHIDDMFHASINGRGKYVNAGSPQEMVDAMNALKQDIESRLGSSASLATSSIQRQVGTNIYQGIYNTSGWFGEVNALEVDTGTGAVGDPVWRASEHVPAWGSRNILSYDGSGGIVFDFNNISDAQATLLSYNSTDPANPFSDEQIPQIVDFIRGDTSNNVSHGGPFRVRTKPIGDFIHSAPTYYKGVIYIGSNDGMLHAIDAATGAEKFCYVPGLVYDHLSDLAIPGYSHKYYVDGTPAVGNVGSQDILVCGLGKGGKGVFGLDVTTPNAMTASKVLWEFPATTDNDMGYSYSNISMVKTKAAGAGNVIIFGNGYDSVNQKAVLYVLNPVDGTVIKKLDTLTAGCNGLSSPIVVDVDSDTYADYAYAGDLLGNMWKFDLRGTSIGDWKVYYADGSTPKPLITVRNSATTGYVQPITTAPEVMLDCVKSDFSDSGVGLMVIFGTGRYLNSGDLGDTSIQSFYGIWDWGNIWEEKSGGGTAGYAVAKTKYLGTLSTTKTLNGPSVSGKKLLAQTMGPDQIVNGVTYVTFSDNPVIWYDPILNTGTDLGWYFDLPSTGERGIREPMLRMGVAVLISVIPSSSPCEAGGSSVLYQVNACTGGRTEEPQFDANGDGKIDDDDLIDGLPPTGRKFNQMLFEGIEMSNMLYLSDSQGNVNVMQVPAKPLGTLFWRVIQ